MSLVAVTLRLSHGRASASPGIGGITGLVPVAITTARPAVRRRTPPSGPPTSTTFSPARRAAPRMSVTCRSSSHGSWPESSQFPTMESRQARAAPTSIAPVTASAAPGTRRAAATTSPGRSSVFDGMQPQ